MPPTQRCVRDRLHSLESETAFGWTNRGELAAVFGCIDLFTDAVFGAQEYAEVDCRVWCEKAVVCRENAIGHDMVRPRRTRVFLQRLQGSDNLRALEIAQNLNRRIASTSSHHAAARVARSSHQIQVLDRASMVGPP